MRSLDRKSHGFKPYVRYRTNREPKRVRRGATEETHGLADQGDGDLFAGAAATGIERAVALPVEGKRIAPPVAKPLGARDQRWHVCSLIDDVLSEVVAEPWLKAGEPLPGADLSGNLLRPGGVEQGREKEASMTKSAPPVPPANQTDKGPSKEKTPAGSDPGNVQGTPNPDQKGQQANTKQNTTHQGYQQDR
jgi:hypothetical protein